MTNFAELKKIVDDLTRQLEEADKCKKFEDVKINFQTFDEHFDENSDEFQHPDEITAVDLDILNWNSVTFTIEKKAKNE